MFDKLNETVAADDLTGRNNCALHLRITGIWHLGYQACRTYFSQDAISFETESHKGRKHHERE